MPFLQFHAGHLGWGREGRCLAVCFTVRAFSAENKSWEARKEIEGNRGGSVRKAVVHMRWPLQTLTSQQPHLFVLAYQSASAARSCTRSSQLQHPAHTQSRSRSTYLASHHHLRSHIFTSHLSAPTPHPLQKPIPLAEPVDAIVRLAHGPHEAAQRVHLVLARVPPVLVHLADRDLHAAVVLGLDDAVRRAAFAGDVAVRGEEGWKVSGCGLWC